MLLLFQTNAKIILAISLLIITETFASSQTKDPKLTAYDINFYYLDLEVDNKTANISGSCTIEAVIINHEIDTIALELIDQAQIDSILINKQKSDFIHADDLVLIPVSGQIIQEEAIEILVFYTLIDGDIITTRGISNSSNQPNREVTWTLSEPFYSKYWFPCKQDLTDKIDSAYLFFTAPENIKVGSNGILTDVTDMGNGKNRFEWKTNFPMAYYLISFSAAEYMDYSFYATIGNSDSVLVQNFIYRDSSYFLKAKADIDATGSLLELFSEKYGTYPFAEEKYGHCVAPVSGGMEHQTMTTLSDFGFNLVAHELAHQWFGDYVTCASWQDIWLNEGFASYSEFVAIENLKNDAEKFAWLEKAYSLVVSEPTGSVHVPELEIQEDRRIFNYRLSYRKGAYIIHMIRHEIENDDMFYQVLETFLDRNKNDVATLADFKQILEEISGKDFTAFFNQWYYGSGYPILDFKWKQTNDSLYITVYQETSDPEKIAFFDLSIDIKISFLGGDTTVNIRPIYSGEEFALVFDKRVYQIIIDQEKWLLAEKRSIERILVGDTAAQFAVFPNPTKEIIYIENFQFGLPFQAKLYNSNGVFIDELEGSGAFTSINLEDQTTGIYQIIIIRDTYKEVFKVAKQ